MAKIRCRECDICHEQMGGWDFQFWIRKPKIKYGYPNFIMHQYDVCDNCFAALSVIITEERNKVKELRDKRDGDC